MCYGDEQSTSEGATRPAMSRRVGIPEERAVSAGCDTCDLAGCAQIGFVLFMVTVDPEKKVSLPKKTDGVCPHASPVRQLRRRSPSQLSLLSEVSRSACRTACPRKQTGSRLFSQLSYTVLPANTPGCLFPRPWTSSPPAMTPLHPQRSLSSSSLLTL